MKKQFTKILIILSTLTVLFFNFSLVLAAPLENSSLLARITLDPNLKPENSPGVIIGSSINSAGAESAFANYLLQMLAGGLITIAAPVAIIIIAISGLMAVVSHGSEGLTGKAKNTLKWAIIGLVIIIFAWVIVRATLSIVLSTNQNQSGTTTQNPPADTAAPGNKTVGGGGVK